MHSMKQLRIFRQLFYCAMHCGSKLKRVLGHESNMRGGGGYARRDPEEEEVLVAMSGGPTR
jgi:hypothetical protein